MFIDDANPACRPTRRHPDRMREAQVISDMCDAWGDGWSIVEVPDLASRPNGRADDLLYEGMVFPVTSNMALEESRAAYANAADAATALPGKVLQDDEDGKLVLHGAFKVMHRTCRHCGEDFTQHRPVSQRRRWSWFCSPAHQAEGKRTADRERLRMKRAA
ncbi:hypothetical protein ACIBM4_26100 [Streptomyces sp. NPDC050256]|uniref:hypothetical protein n=1 Tax=Streptomyces sp. NPDC050256 TaxID=3365607 RepID=UPI00379EA635